MDLVTIGRKTIEIAIDPDGTTGTFRGLGLGDLRKLQTRFPELYSLLDVPRTLAFERPDIVVAILAISSGHEETEGRCAEVSAFYQVDVLGRILAMTFPGGLGPFVEALSRLDSSIAGPPVAKPEAEPTQAEISPQPSTS